MLCFNFPQILDKGESERNERTHSLLFYKKITPIKSFLEQASGNKANVIDFTFKEEHLGSDKRSSLFWSGAFAIKRFIVQAHGQ